MHLYLRKNRWTGVAALSLVLLAACGPVKFSSSSSENPSPVGPSGTPTPTITPTGTPSPTPSPTVPPKLRDVRYNGVVPAKDYKLDIVLIIDDSNSMLADNQKLAANLSGFINKLQTSNIDWQMCATVTRALEVSAGNFAWGASIYWQNSSTVTAANGMVLKKGVANLNNFFTHTMNYIGAGWAGSDDERGIKAAYRHVYNGDLRYNPNNGCYRADSAVTYIIISDEDERSVGGDASQQYYVGELKALETEDQPSVFVDSFKDTFGATRRFTVNSIIVKPGDTACMATQDAGGAKAHYGFRYAELSTMTGGGVGSICATDYSTNMDLFFGKIQDSLSSLPLECSPYNGNISVTVTPAMGALTSRVDGRNLVFSTPIPAGTTLDVRYQCDDSRLPASLSGEGPTALSFWDRIVMFFKGLFL